MKNTKIYIILIITFFNIKSSALISYKTFFPGFFDAKSTALGGANSCYGNEINALLFNPANAIFAVPGLKISYNHCFIKEQDDAYLYTLKYDVSPSLKNTIGYYKNKNSMFNNIYTGFYNVTQKLNESLVLGFNMKYIRVYDNNSNKYSSFSYDFGIIQIIRENVITGFTLHDVKTTLRNDTYNIPIETMVDYGICYFYKQVSFYFNLDSMKYERLGIEIHMNSFDIRFGTGERFDYFSTGFGFIYRKLLVDYGYIYYRNDNKDNLHSLSVSWFF